MEEANTEASPPDLTVYEKESIFPWAHFSKAKIKAFKIPVRKKNEYLMVCAVCPSGLTNVKAAEQHISGKHHKMKLKEDALDQILSQPPPLANSDLSSLTAFVENVYRSQSVASLDQLTLRCRIGEELQTLIHDPLPDISVQLHGSSASEFAVMSSNVNLNLDIPSAEDSQKTIPDVMNGVLAVLRSNVELYDNIIADYYAFNKIPRILFIHKKSGLSCEIRAMAGNPMWLAPLLKCYGGMDQRVFQLGVLFLHWAKICKLDVQMYGYFPGHMFVVMVIHFLQQTTPPIIPVLHEVGSQGAPPGSEEGLEEARDFLTEDEMTNFLDVAKEWRIENTQSLGELWLQLLRYYTIDFEVTRFAVSIRQSGPLLRGTRQWGVHRLAVEDPMIPKSNLARCVYHDKVYEYYVTCLKQTTAYFYNQLSSGAPSISPSLATPPTGAPSISPFLATPPTGAPSISPPLETPTGVQDDDSSVVFATSLATPTSSVATPPSYVTTPTEPTPSLGDHGGNSSTNLESSFDSSNVANTTPSSKGPLSTSLSSQDDVATAVAGVACVMEELNIDGQSASLDTKSTAGIVDTKSTASLDTKSTDTKSTDAKSTDAKSTAGIVDTKATAGIVDTKSTAGRIVQFELSYSNCVLHNYLKVCSVCKNSAKHTYMDCPNEALPDTSCLSTTPPPSKDSLQVLGQVFKAYMKDVAPSKRDIKERKNICRFILDLIHHLYPDADLKLFGSSANGFGLYTSDLDICLIIPGLKPTDAQSEKAQHKEVIEKIAREMRRYRDYEQVVAITSARVPIVKFSLGAWGLDCDVSMENRLAVRNTEMLKVYTTVDDRVKPLGYAVKKFAKVCDMGDASSGSLSSYAHVLLMLHYLQHTDPPVVPVLQQLPLEGRSEGPIINGWNCYYFHFDSPLQLKTVWSGWGKNNQSVGELWLGFLRYMLTFNWNKYVVTIKQLEPLAKFDKWWNGKSLCIEDPFNLDHNLGASVSGKMRGYILERFRTGFLYHSNNAQWLHMDHVMDDAYLVGDCKAPKFLLCHYCNMRGHRQTQCPVKMEERRSQSKQRHKKAPPPQRDHPPHKDHPPQPSRAHTHPSHKSHPPQPHPSHEGHPPQPSRAHTHPPHKSHPPQPHSSHKKHSPQPSRAHTHPSHKNHPLQPLRAHTHPTQGVPFTARALLPNPSTGPFPPTQIQSPPPQPIRLQSPSSRPIGLQQNRPMFIMQRPPPNQPMGLQQGVPYQQQMFPYPPLYYTQPTPQMSLPHTPTHPPTSLPHNAMPQTTPTFPGPGAPRERQN